MERRRMSLLYEAAYEGSVTTLLELLQQDKLILDRIIVNDININGLAETPLHVAAMLGHADFVKEITNRKPQLSEELDSGRSTPLHLAAAKGHVDTVKALLLAAARGVNSEMIICFAADREGRNPLHLAAMRGRLEVLRELLRAAPAAARATSPANRGETILHMCLRYNQLEALGVLVEVIDDYQFVNAKDDYGMTVLHLAVADKQIETVKFLLANTRVEVNAVNASGFTALDILAQSQRNKKDLDISECLRSNGAFKTIDISHVQRPKATSTTTLPFVSVHNQNESTAALEKFRKDTTKKPEDWLTRKRESLMVVASLIANMAFQAVTNPPGGLWQDNSEDPSSQANNNNNNNTDSHKAGESIMAHRDYKNYDLYLYFNTVGFVASLSIILLLVTGLPFKRRFFMWVLTVLVSLTITAMALTYRVYIQFFTPPEQAQVARRVISYGVNVWSGVMSFVLLLHTIHLVASLFGKLENLIWPRKKTEVVPSG